MPELFAEYKVPENWNYRQNGIARIIGIAGIIGIHAFHAFYYDMTHLHCDGT